jgi:activator of HSP90 ATPase
VTTYDFEVSAIISARADVVFATWMSSTGHSRMTGGEALIDSRVGGSYSAWGGYITGTTLVLESPRCLVQSWRSADFGPDDPDSTIEVTFDPLESGTRVTIRHRGVPSDQRGYESEGWAEFYLEPMTTFFARSPAG